VLNQRFQAPQVKHIWREWAEDAPRELLDAFMVHPPGAEPSGQSISFVIHADDGRLFTVSVSELETSQEE